MSPTPDITPPASALSDRHLLDGLGDVGRAFFNFPSLTEVQHAAIVPVAEGHNILLCAATASGKTEAVFAPLIWRLRRSPRPGPNGPFLLAVAPTRALVADLVARLETPLSRIDWRCAAQTSDFTGADSAPEVLVTTPESFDSMLVRRSQLLRGKPAGHLLANVAAVFLDEAHCLDNTCRGAQTNFLLARLSKLRATAFQKGWTRSAALQLCAASATIFEPQPFAELLLGPGAQAVACAGSRPIEILTASNQWLPLQDGRSAPELASLLPQASERTAIADLVWQALEPAVCRKALIFVNSRRQCDLLSQTLAEVLSHRRAIWVGAHHGSLSRELRRDAEDLFHRERDAALVATSTLEVGVDIGDVDVIVLVGPPSDTASLLQRIGRGGRRLGLTRVLAIPRNGLEAAAFASLLITASAGQLEPKRRFRRWDVLPQQVISYIRQNYDLGRTPASIAELAQATWPGGDVLSLSQSALRHWQETGHLQDRRGRLHLAGDWENFAAQADSDYYIHSNISSTSLGLAVRDSATGEIVAHVADVDDVADTLTLAGKRRRIVRNDGDLVVQSLPHGSANTTETTPNYGGRRRLISQTFAAHIRTGLGLDDMQAPLLDAGGRLVWFHFAGEIFEKLLVRLLHGFVGKPVLPGIAVHAFRRFDAQVLAAFSTSDVEDFIREMGLRLCADEGLGKFAPALSPELIDAMLKDLAFADQFSAWCNTRQLPLINADALRVNPRLAPIAEMAALI